MREDDIRNFTTKGLEEKDTRKISHRNSGTRRIMHGETFEEYYYRFDSTFSRLSAEITHEELIQLFLDKLSDYEKNRGKA